MLTLIPISFQLHFADAGDDEGEGEPDEDEFDADEPGEGELVEG